jgi:hypothetical protein
MLRGYAVRAVVLLFVALAGGASAFEERRPVVLARFAYVNTAVFEPSFASPPAQPKAAVTSPPAIVHSGPEAVPSVSTEIGEYRPVLLIAAEADVTQPSEPKENARATGVADGIDTIKLIAEFVPLAPVHRAAPRLASLEPVTVLAELAPDRMLKARDEVLKARPEEPVLPRRIVHRERTRASAAHAMHRNAPSKKKKVASAKVPRWATRMFDGPWQSHAFSYQ